MTASVSATTCTRCRRAPASGTKTNGAPHLRCAKCRAHAKALYVPLGPVYGRTCDWCAGEIDPNKPTKSKYCSKKCGTAKSNAARPVREPICGRPCVVCGKEIDSDKRADAKYCSDECRVTSSFTAQYAPCPGGCGSSVITAGWSPESKCRTCTAIARGCLTPEVRAGTDARCQCQGCYYARRDGARAAKLKYRELHGESYMSTRWRINKKPDQFHLSPEHRLRLFERDGWLCMICHEPTSPTFSYTDPLSPTLDHIEPQSAVLIPDHGDANLRLTHAICNMMRGNRMELDAVIAERSRERRQFQETRLLNPLT